MSTLKVDTLQTTGGAGLYPAKAWVNFNGTGTPAIRASGNVSSITDVSTGEYYANFSSAISDADYCISATTYLAGSATPAPFALASSTAQARLWVRASSTNVGYDTGWYNLHVTR